MVKHFQYFNFQNAREAIDYYKNNFSASLVSIQMMDDKMFEDTSEFKDIPADVKENFVMHAEIEILGHGFYISDTWNGKPINNEGAMMAFVFDLETEKDQMVSFYEQAVESGVDVQMPMEEAEWTPMFASFKDKYGINWMLSGE